MSLKGLKSKFKHKSAEKYLRQELKGFPPPVQREAPIGSVAIIVDLERFGQEERFHSLVEVLGLRPNAIRIIGYRAQYDKNSPYATPVFSDKDLGWKGAIENSYVLEFLSREYDLLINYFDEPRLLLQLLSLKVRAGMRIGFPGVNPAFNDLILECPLTEFEVVREEILKYLKLLNKLR
jgi:hypothetical protein